MTIESIINERLSHVPRNLKVQIKYTILAYLKLEGLLKDEPKIDHYPIEKFEIHIREIICETFEKEICKEVSDFTEEIVTPEMLNFNTRKREVVLSRQLAMVYRRKKMGKSLRFSGMPYGKDHATVMHAVETVANLRDTNKPFNDFLCKLGEKINFDFKY